MRALENQEAGAGGEIQLTDALAQMIGLQAFHAVTFDGERYDCSKLGFVQATMALALEREDIGVEVREVRGTVSQSTVRAERLSLRCQGDLLLYLSTEFNRVTNKAT